MPEGTNMSAEYQPKPEATNQHGRLLRGASAVIEFAFNAMDTVTIHGLGQFSYVEPKLPPQGGKSVKLNDLEAMRGVHPNWVGFGDPLRT